MLYDLTFSKSAAEKITIWQKFVIK
jgi:hypothetical protein